MNHIGWAYEVFVFLVYMSDVGSRGVHSVYDDTEIPSHIRLALCVCRRLECLQLYSCKREVAREGSDAGAPLRFYPDGELGVPCGVLAVRCSPGNLKNPSCLSFESDSRVLWLVSGINNVDRAPVSMKKLKICRLE